MEQCVELLVGKFGIDAFKSLSAIMILDDSFTCGYKFCTRIYINFKASCWIHEVTRTIDDINFPEHLPVSVCVSKGTICYASNSNELRDEYGEAKGLVYSLYDEEETLIVQPKWKEWFGSCVFLKLPSLHPSPYNSDDEDDYWAVEPNYDD
jgi:hypothetical protein